MIRIIVIADKLLTVGDLNKSDRIEIIRMKMIIIHIVNILVRLLSFSFIIYISTVLLLPIPLLLLLPLLLLPLLLLPLL